LVLIVGGTLGWLARSARIQRDAVKAIENAGGQTTYNWEWKNRKFVLASEPKAPRWLRSLSELSLAETQVTDRDLASVT
jgi:hypothetical protein